MQVSIQFREKSRMLSFLTPVSPEITPSFGWVIMAAAGMSIDRLLSSMYVRFRPPRLADSQDDILLVCIGVAMQCSWTVMSVAKTRYRVFTQEYIKKELSAEVRERESIS